ncbi:DUF2515 family protein [Chloroflexus sp.]|uniref:DUF2515 family protein n=1 Tax=Chloroflexus sp. TaxID=1904827 RepID=UPI00298EEE74|nr:hypothetical protein [Chloroflexus sp.]MDW8406105.1 hypothetical protein [Chloroflexus sp.]
MPTKAGWCDLINRHLPPAEQMVARNRAITAAYAGWYLRQPWLFRWAGLAAFASAQVGIGIALAEQLLAPQRMIEQGAVQPANGTILAMLGDLVGQGVSLALIAPTLLHAAATGQLLADLLIIKQANDAIFSDTGWAHLAYIHGGLAELERCVASADHAILAAFRMLDEGARQLCEPDTFAQGWELVNQATIALLRHEQMTILPPYMAQLSDIGRLIATLGTWMDFTGNGPAGGPSFSNFFGLPAVLSGARSIANTTDRWTWIERDLLPAWFAQSAAYREGSPLDRRLRTLAGF